MPLVTVLPILRPFLLAFGCVFSRPQQRHFGNYIQSLVCQNHRRTLAGMSRHVVDGPDASNWDRFVTAAPWELTELIEQWARLRQREVRRLKPAALRIAGRFTEFWICDDSHQRRTGAFLEGAGYHWNPSEGRACWGHSLVLTAYRVGDYTFGTSCDMYVRETELRQLHAERRRANVVRDLDAALPLPPFRSKIDLVVARLQAFRPSHPDRQAFALFDSWYLNRRVVQTARARGLDWCSTLKRNRSLTLVELTLETGELRSEQKVTVQALLSALEPAEWTEDGVPFPAATVAPRWETFTVQGRTYRALAYRARLAGIGLVQVVIAQERWQGGRWSPYVVLATNRLDLTAWEVVRVYQERWEIEVLIRDGKQNLGLGDSQIERLEGTVRHWVLSLLSQGLLTLLRLQADAGEACTASGQPIASVGQTLGEVRQFVQRCALVELIRWVCDQAVTGRKAEEIALSLGLPA